MDTSEPSSKRRFVDNLDSQRERDREGDGRESSDKRRHRSSKSRKHTNTDEPCDWEDSRDRRKNSPENVSNKKKLISSSKADSSDENECDERRVSGSRTVREEQDGDDYLSKGGNGDHHERNDKKTSGVNYEKTSIGGRKGREEGRNRSEEVVLQKRHPESKESDRDRSQSSRTSKQKDEQDGKSKRRWDVSDSTRPSIGEVMDEDYKSERRSGKSRDSKVGSTREKNIDTRSEASEYSSKGRRVSDSYHGKGDEGKSARSNEREDKRNDEGERRGKSRGRSEDDGGRSFGGGRDDKLDGLRDDKQKHSRERIEDRDNWDKSSSQRQTHKGHDERSDRNRSFRDASYAGRDDTENKERHGKPDDHEHGERSRAREKRDSGWDDGGSRSGRGARHTRRSWSPEARKRSRRNSEEYEREFSDDRADSDTGRSMSLKGKERERDNLRDERPKDRDSDWGERNHDWEDSKDNWKKRHHERHEKEGKDGDGDFDYDRDFDLHRRDRDRMEREKLHRGSGERANRGRMEGSKSFATTSDGSDRTGSQVNSLDYGRTDNNSSFMGWKNDTGTHQDFAMGTPERNWGFNSLDEKARMGDAYGSGFDMQDRYDDDGPPGLDQNLALNSGRMISDVASDSGAVGRGRGQKASLSNMNRVNQSGNMPQSPFANTPGTNSFARVGQGGKGGRPGRPGRGRITARDGQRGGIPLPLMSPSPGPGVPPFAHIAMPPAPMQTLGPNMSPSPGPPLGPGAFMPPYGGHMVWTGPRPELNMLAVPPGLAPIPPPGPTGPRFVPNMGPGPNQAIYFGQPGIGRGIPPNMPGPGFGGNNSMGRGMPGEKGNMGRGPPRITGPPGKAPSRGEQNDYSQNFVDTGMRPQNFIRELELTSVVEDYPKLRELIQKKDEIVANSNCAPMYYKCDLKEHVLSPEFFGTKFDVILVDPPWEEYVHRAPGVADHMEYWTFEEIQNLKIEAIADTPSFIFLWVGDGVGLEQGRLCLKKWGFRRCEDICWVKTNKGNATPSLRHDSHTLFQHSKEHCLMGIKGTVRRSTDGHIIHANIDTDIIIAEEPPYGSTIKPEDLYRIIEHFALGRRRIELFGEDHNIRAGWLTVGKGLSSSNFNTEAYVKGFSDKEGKVWQGGGGRNPPPEAPHLVSTTPEIESLRPKSPPQKNQQQQQQGTSISQNAASSTNKKTAGNSPVPHQNSPITIILGGNQEASASNMPFPMSVSPGPPELVRAAGSGNMPIFSGISRVSSVGSRIQEVEGVLTDERVLDLEGSNLDMDMDMR
ncbi:hypothetical protein AMTR_s00029p00224260 [Amborella trichopoda]|uniref:Methyltransferase-like protein 1 n=2 Tax=Amborella trichopoda TaxID=13333 RepID=W1PPT6_AMBTC|nr:hypothetical protein AMTR_s00029p00224260 [Amborella trichopoda]